MNIALAIGGGLGFALGVTNAYQNSESSARLAERAAFVTILCRNVIGWRTQNCVFSINPEYRVQGPAGHPAVKAKGYLCSLTSKTTVFFR